jgi:glycosyltransferase involved in cell wall biosynthesis
LVEAIIYGCIPFVSNLEANLELIEDGKNGFVENDLEHIDFAKYIQVDNEMFEMTRQEVIKTFSKAENKKRYFEIYDEVIQS